MRVCFLTHYFPPEVGAPQTRIELLARALARAGEEVTVHTGFPHYPDGGVRPPYRNRPWLKETRDGVTVVRSAVYPAANQGFAPRLLDHTAFSLSALATAHLTGPADVVVAESPPLFTAAAGVLYARRKRAAYVVNVADRWPASAVELGALRNARAIQAAEALEHWIYTEADLIVSPTEGIADAIANLPSGRGKSRRVWPVVDLDRFDPTWPERSGDGDRHPLRVLFAGTVGLAHGLELLVEASRLLGPQTVQTTIAGGGAEADRIRRLIETGRIDNVRMLGVLQADRIPGLYHETDASAVLLRDLPIFAGALPTKMLEGMAAGRPLVLSARGEAARFVSEAGAGLVTAPGDVAALAAALKQLHDEPELRRSLGAAGRRYVEANFGAQRAAEAWSAQLRRAIEHRAGRGGGSGSSWRRSVPAGRFGRAVGARRRAD